MKTNDVLGMLFGMTVLAALFILPVGLIFYLMANGILK